MFTRMDTNTNPESYVGRTITWKSSYGPVYTGVCTKVSPKGNLTVCDAPTETHPKGSRDTVRPTQIVRVD